ncbi:hypothetical protein B0O99DRAFT_629474 [Bisporella sp. PMI_857]|nr:hypothetical protein B0O99DRAFT_629474 [Bisporella sp. PMI_857]
MTDKADYGLPWLCVAALLTLQLYFACFLLRKGRGVEGVRRKENVRKETKLFLNSVVSVMWGDIVGVKLW